MTTSTSDTGVDGDAPSAITVGRQRTPQRPASERQWRRPVSSSSKFTSDPVTDPDAALEQQLRDDRFSEMKADLALEYVDNLQLPNYRDMGVPGYKLISTEVAREFGLAGLGDEENDDPLGDIDLGEPLPEPVGAVDGNQVPSFVDGVKGQHVFDTLNSTLLAQLAANSKYDRETEAVPWSKYYGRVLENVAWVVPAFDFRQLTSRDTRFSMHTAIIKVITSIMTAGQVEIVQSTLEALRELNSDDRRAQIFARNSVQHNAGNFQIDNVGESAAGHLSMKLCAFSFKTDEAVTDVLWWRFKSGSTQMQVSRTTLVLNDQVYERLRQPIIDKLGSRGLNYIGGLELAEN